MLLCLIRKHKFKKKELKNKMDAISHNIFEMLDHDTLNHLYIPPVVWVPLVDKLIDEENTSEVYLCISS